MRHSASPDWDIAGADEEQWCDILDADGSDAHSSLAAWGRSLVLYGVVLVIFLGAAWLALVLWRDAQQGIALIEADASAIVRLETLRQNAENPACKEVTAVESVAIGADGLMVRVLVTGTSGLGHVHVFQESRFYTRCDAGWQRSPPLPAFWGQDATLGTEHFTFSFRELDRTSVEHAAAVLDTCVVSLRARLDLPVMTPDDRIAVAVVPYTVYQGARLRDGTLLQPSPFLLRVPRHLDAASLLAVRLQLLVLEQLVEETANFSVESRGNSSLPQETTDAFLKCVASGLHVAQRSQPDVRLDQTGAAPP